MSVFKNITDVDLEVQVDGKRILAPAGGSFAVPDEFDYQLVEQPYYQIVTGRAKPAAAPAASTADVLATTEGEK